MRELVDVGGMTAESYFQPRWPVVVFPIQRHGHLRDLSLQTRWQRVQNLDRAAQRQTRIRVLRFLDFHGRKQILHTIHNGTVAKTAIMNADGSDRHPIDVPGVDYFYMAALSPDSQRMAFANVATDYSLMLAELASGKSRLLDKGLASGSLHGPAIYV